MMKRFIFSLLLLSITLGAGAQVVADRTNQVQLDFTKPIVATKLAKIVWELPRL